MPLTRFFKETVKARAAHETGTPEESLMRMLGPRSNPNARNLFSVIHCLQSASGVQLKVGPAR